MTGHATPDDLPTPEDWRFVTPGEADVPELRRLLPAFRRLHRGELILVNPADVVRRDEAAKQPEPGTLAEALAELDSLTKCRCEPPWTDRRLHETHCKSEYAEDVAVVRAALAECEAASAGFREQADPLDAAANPRVIAVLLARHVSRFRTQFDEEVLCDGLAVHGITATEEQARALLDAVAAWDEHSPCDVEVCNQRRAVGFALDAILGDRS